MSHWSTFVKEINEDIARFNKSKINNGNLLTDLESDLFIRQVQQFLKPLENSEEDIFSVSMPLHQLAELVKKRNEKALSTDALALLTKSTPGNLLSWRLCERLAVELHTNPFKLLIPTLQVTESDITNHKLSDLKLHQFVLTDDNAYPIEILECLNYAAEHNGSFKTTCKINGVRRDLTPAEFHLVRNHSPLTQSYVLAIGEHKYADRTQQIQEAKEKLTDAITKDSYHVTVSYGKEGEKTLENRLLQQRNELFFNRDQLINYMMKYLNKFDWQNFLDSINEKVVQQLILNGSNKNIRSEISKLAMNGNDAHDKAQLFAMIYVYWKEREKQPTYTTYKGSWLGKSKEQDKIIVDVVKEFLTGTRMLSEWNEFVKLKSKEKGKEDLANLIYSYGSFTKLFAQTLENAGKISEQQQYKRTKAAVN